MGFEGFYEVSSFGRLRSLDRVQVNARGAVRRIRGRMISLDSLGNGYPVSVLMRNGEKKVVRIHRLVAEAFIPNPDNLPMIDHIDTDRQNNRVENLRWVDSKGNANNPITKMKSAISSTKEFGSGWKTILTKNARGSCKAEIPICQFTLEGEFIRRYRSYSEASAETGIERCPLRRAVNGSYRQAGGFLWAKEGERPNERFINTSTWSKKVYQYDKNGSFIREWISACEAERSLRITNISRCIRFPGRTAGGYRWSFVKKENFFDD